MSSASSARPLVDLAAWRYFERCSPGRIGPLFLLGLVAAGQSLLLLPVLLLIRHAVDTVIPARQINMLVLIGVGIFALRATSGAVALWLRAAHVRLLKGATLRLRADLLERLYLMSRAAYTRLDRDTTHARLVLDTERLDEMSHTVVAKLVPAVFSATVLLVVLGFLNPPLLILMLGLAPLVPLATRLTGTRVQQAVFVFQRAFETFSHGMQFVLQHMDLTVTQSHEGRETRRRVADMDQLRRSSERMAFIYAVHGQLQSLIVALCGVVILVAGGAAVAGGRMTIGQFLAFWVAAGLLNQQVMTIVGAIPDVIAGNESMMTLHRFATGGEARPYRGSEPLRFGGRIDIDGVDFGYLGIPVVRNAWLTIRPGATVALAGPNGAGKSTLLYLILGFYRPQQGLIRADGVPYDRLDLVALRRQIGVVMQHPELFAGSVFENIVYGEPEASREEVREAARLALADDFIAALPQGYDTPIGEGGILLSGGEIQRIAIARALLRRPRLLILDEPTNHLERPVIHRLLVHLATLPERPAVLLISHDREVLARADVVYRIEDGTPALQDEPPIPELAGVVPGGA